MARAVSVPGDCLLVRNRVPERCAPRRESWRGSVRGTVDACSGCRVSRLLPPHFRAYALARVERRPTSSLPGRSWSWPVPRGDELLVDRRLPRVGATAAIPRSQADEDFSQRPRAAGEVGESMECDGAPQQTFVDAARNLILKGAERDAQAGKARELVKHVQKDPVGATLSVGASHQVIGVEAIARELVDHEGGRDVEDACTHGEKASRDEVVVAHEWGSPSRA